MAFILTGILQLFDTIGKSTLNYDTQEKYISPLLSIINYVLLSNLINE